MRRSRALTTGTARTSQAPLPLQHAMGLSQPQAPTDDAAGVGSSSAAATSDAYVGRVVAHAIGINNKINQLNQLWPGLVGSYERRVKEEMSDRQLFIQRYEAAAYGLPIEDP